MSKAKQRAKEYAENVMLTVDHRSDVEEAYIDGYEQAEKDLKLKTKSKIMKEQDKKLLLKDLSARIPYKTMLYIEDVVDVYNDRLLAIGLNHGDCLYINGLCVDDNGYDTHNIIKPYLRSLSSMTEEEKIEYYNTMDKETQRNYPNSCDFSESVYYLKTTKTFDWLNENHFDYRNLIDKGLALEAPKEMYD